MTDDRVIQSLAAETRRIFLDWDVHWDCQLAQGLTPAQIARIPNRRDREILEEWRRSQSSQHVAVLPQLMPLGLISAETRGKGGRIAIVRSYASRRSWDSIPSTPGVLVKQVRQTEGYPSQQTMPTCAAHASSSHLHLRGEPGTTAAEAPSRRFVYVRSGQVFGYRPNDGRTFASITDLCLEHGYLLEGELPTGADAFSESEQYTRGQLGLARSRAIHGAVLFESNGTRLAAALDMTSGEGLLRPAGMMVACRIYANWARCFSHGVIVRHTPQDEGLGGHALVLLDFVRIHGVTWGLLLNSWGPQFGAASPMFPGSGIALVSVDYLADILFHGACLYCQTGEEFEQARRAFGGLDRPLRRRAPAIVVPAMPRPRTWLVRSCQKLTARAEHRLADSLAR